MAPQTGADGYAATRSSVCIVLQREPRTSAASAALERIRADTAVWTPRPAMAGVSRGHDGGALASDPVWAAADRHRRGGSAERPRGRNGLPRLLRRCLLGAIRPGAP